MQKTISDIGMKHFGLIGHPVSGSLSPALFQAGYREKYGRDYVYRLIEGEDFETSYRTFIEEYDGINVTAPFKEKAFRKADIADATCTKTGAANLLIKTGDGIKAYNTDYFGIQMSLLKAAGHYRKVWRTALVVGCGGAGKAAAAAAAGLSLEVTLMNRTVSRAEETAASMPEYGFRIKPLEEFCRYFREADVIIYTLPGSIPQIDALTMEDFRGGKTGCKRKFVLEANYRTPSFNAGIIGKMSEANPEAEYIPGRDWLLYQAIGGYGLFTGEEPDRHSMHEVLYPGETGHAQKCRFRP